MIGQALDEVPRVGVLLHDGSKGEWVYPLGVPPGIKREQLSIEVVRIVDDQSGLAVLTMIFNTGDEPFFGMRQAGTDGVAIPPGEPVSVVRKQTSAHAGKYSKH